MARRPARTVDPITGEPIVVDDRGNGRMIDVSDDAVAYGGAIPPEDALEYPPPETRVVHERVPYAVSARGGLSATAVIGGMLTAFGVMLIGSVATGLVAANTDVNAADGASLRLGLTAAIVFVAVQFVAYLYGGYTAGRMARGAGLLNGMFVALAAVGLGALTILIVRATGNEPSLAVPFQNGRLAIDRGTIYNFGAWTGIASLAAMFVGGMLGGMMGTRWHTKLDRDRIAADYYADAEAKT